jgi:vanillate O-demethylase ferredoxin subunit
MVHFDDYAAEKGLDLARLLGTCMPGTHLYVCGPKGFMNAVLSTAREKGWSEEQLHYEFFSSEAVKSDGDESFEVKLASWGRVILVAKMSPSCRRWPRLASRCRHLASKESAVPA